MANDNPLSDLKQCRECGEYFPRNTDYFFSQKRYKDGLGSYCKPCHRAINRRNIRNLRENNPEYDKDYYSNNRERVLLRTAVNARKNRARKNELQRIRRHKNRDGINAERRKKRSNPEYLKHERELEKAAKQRRIERDPEGQKAKRKSHAKQAKAKRRARLYQASGTHTAKELRELLEWQDYKCFYCGADLHDGYTSDHYYPLNSAVKDNSIHNIYLACKSCNSSKQDKLPFLFDSRCL